MDSRKHDYLLSRMDVLIVQLVRRGDYQFVEDVLALHDVLKYDPLPVAVQEEVANILQERLDYLEHISEEGDA